MTKKYWNDWKKRIGETINIYIFWWNHINGRKRKASCGLLEPEDRIVKATFHEKSIDLTIERKTYVFSISSGPHFHSENECVTLDREKIACIEFKKIKK